MLAGVADIWHAIVTAFSHFIDALRGHPYIEEFVLIALETALILHFVPAIGVVIIAAAHHGNTVLGFTAVVLVATAGATAGSWFVYVASRFGGRGFIERHPRLFGLSAARLARLDKVFHHPSGEFMVFAFRLVPFMRALISIPAGLGEMALGRYLMLTALGHFVLNFVLVLVTVITCRGGGCTRASLLEKASMFSHRFTHFWAVHWLLGGLVVAAAGVVTWVVWAQRKRIVAEYDHLLVKTWERTAVASAGAGLLLLALALVAPDMVRDSAEVLEHSLRTDPIVLLVLIAITMTVVGGLLLALRYALATPLRRMRERRRARRLQPPSPPQGP